MTYRKIGGLHHFRLWRFGVSWYWAKAKPRATRQASDQCLDYIMHQL